MTCRDCEGSARFLSTSSQLKLAVTQLRSNTDDGDDDEGGDGVESYQEAS